MAEEGDEGGVEKEEAGYEGRVEGEKETQKGKEEFGEGGGHEGFQMSGWEIGGRKTIRRYLLSVFGGEATMLSNYQIIKLWAALFEYQQFKFECRSRGSVSNCNVTVMHTEMISIVDKDPG